MSVDKQIYDTAISQGFTDTSAKLVVAQARFESADYTAPNFRNNNSTSGMKYVGQPMASKSAKPSPEGDYYAKYNTVQDAINDKIVRLYNITMKGVTPQQLKNSKTPEEFAELLKKRGYYGNNKYGTLQGNVEMKNYAAGLKAKLRKINFIEFVEKTVEVTNEKIAEIKDSKYLIYIGIAFLGLGIGLYFYNKK